MRCLFATPHHLCGAHKRGCFANWFAAHRHNLEGRKEYDNTSDAVTDAEIETLITNMPHCPSNLQKMFRETERTQTLRSSTLRQLEPLEYHALGRVVLLGDSANAMAPTAGLGVLLGLINVLHLVSNLKNSPNDVPKALANYNDSVVEHTNTFLTCTNQLTSTYYTDNPLATAKEAHQTYQALFDQVKAATDTAISSLYKKTS